MVYCNYGYVPFWFSQNRPLGELIGSALITCAGSYFYLWLWIQSETCSATIDRDILPPINTTHHIIPYHIFHQFQSIPNPILSSLSSPARLVLLLEDALLPLNLIATLYSGFMTLIFLLNLTVTLFSFSI
jgi:hypothetical protein